MSTAGGASVATATVITKGTGAWSSDPTSLVVEDPDYQYVFWRYTPAVDGTLTFSNDQSSAGDTFLILTSGPADATDLNELTIVDYSSDSRPGLHEYITSPVTAAETYYLITLLAEPSSAFTTFILTIEDGPASVPGDGSPSPPHLRGRTSASIRARVQGHYTAPAISTGAATIAAATTIIKGTGTWQSSPTGPAGLSNPVRNRDAIWKYTPLTSGTLVYSNDQSTAGDTYLGLYSGPANATSAAQLTQVQDADDNRSGSHEYISYPVTAGLTYYLITSMYGGGSLTNYVLTIESGPPTYLAAQGPIHTIGRTSASVRVHAALHYQPPIHLGGRTSVSLGVHGSLDNAGPMHITGRASVSLAVHASVGYSGPIHLGSQVSVPVQAHALASYTLPLHLGSRVAVPVTVRATAANTIHTRGHTALAIELHAALQGNSFAGMFVLSSPQNGAVVASSTPAFVVAVVADDVADSSVYTVEVQYQGVFTSPVTLTATFDASDGGAILRPASAVPDTTIWCARLFKDGVLLNDWTDVNTFTVVLVETFTVPVTWSVDPSAQRLIHLWHLDPPGPDVGDTVTAYGHGFPSSGHLIFDDQPLSTTGWQLVPATGANTTTDRLIDGEQVTCEHYEVTFTAPDYDGPGAEFSVEA